MPATPYFSLKSKSNRSKEIGFGLIVSRRVSKKAVARNLLKRRAREIFRQNSGRIKKGHDLIFVFYPEALNLSFHELENEIFNSLEKARLLK